MRYLMTQSLLSSWLYTFNCPDDYEEEAFNDFLSTLRREPHETNEAMQNGIDFENLVTAILNGAPTAIQRDKVWGRDEFKVRTVPVQETKQVNRVKEAEQVHLIQVMKIRKAAEAP